MNFEQFETIPIYRSIINYSRKITKSDINPKNFPPIPLTPLNLKYLNRYNFPHYYNIADDFDFTTFTMLLN